MFVAKTHNFASFNLISKVLASFCREGVKCSRKLSTSTPPQAKWQLMSAAIVERAPTITQEMTKIEKEFAGMMAAIEKENSVLSDHGLRHIEDKKAIEKKKQIDLLDLETDAVLQTAQEMEDVWQEECEAFKLAPRITEADEKNDLKSLDRKLDRKLVLLIEQKFGKSTHWVSPMGIRRENESMREAAERILVEQCGDQLKVEFLGNAPFGFYQYEYPQHANKDFVGAKVFFFKAHYKSGLPTPSTDYLWVTKEEVRKYTPKKYGSTVKKLILEN